MASSQRINRINGIIQRDLTLLINNKIKDQRVIDASVGVTSVKTTPDLKEATVYVSILNGSDKYKKDIIDVLQGAAGFLRTEVSKGLNTYQTPAFKFKLDDSYEYGNKIDKILEDLKNSGQISEQIEIEEEEEAF